MTEPRLKVEMRIEEIALTPADDIPMPQAIVKAQAAGFTVLRVEGRKIIVQHEEP